MWAAQRLRPRKNQPACQLRRRRANRLDHHEQHQWQYGVSRPRRVVRIGPCGHESDNTRTLIPSAARRRRLVVCVSLKVRLLRPLKMIGSMHHVSVALGKEIDSRTQHTVGDDN